jgi:hypothetical protein
MGTQNKFLSNSQQGVVVQKAVYFKGRLPLVPIQRQVMRLLKEGELPERGFTLEINAFSLTEPRPACLVLQPRVEPRQYSVTLRLRKLPTHAFEGVLTLSKAWDKREIQDRLMATLTRLNQSEWPYRTADDGEEAEVVPASSALELSPVNDEALADSSVYATAREQSRNIIALYEELDTVRNQIAQLRGRAQDLRTWIKFLESRLESISEALSDDERDDIYRLFDGEP